MPQHLVSLEIRSTLCARDVLRYDRARPNIGYSFIESCVTVTETGQGGTYEQLTLDRKER